MKALAIQGDSVDAEAVAVAVERTAGELGGIDIPGFYSCQAELLQLNGN